MKVLVACEYSGRVRDAFIARGHDAISCEAGYRVDGCSCGNGCDFHIVPGRDGD